MLSLGQCRVCGDTTITGFALCIDCLREHERDLAADIVLEREALDE